MTTKILKVNFDGDVGNVTIRAVAGDANSRKILLDFGYELPENTIVRLYVKKAEHVEYIEADGNEIVLTASALEKAGVYPAQIEVLEKDGDEVKSIIQTRAFNLIVENSISSLEAIEGTTNTIDLAAISAISQNISELMQDIDAKEDRLTDAGDNAENKFLNGQKRWVEVSAIQGEKGDKGENGVDGKNAYEMAQDDGFTGSYEDWKESLKGEKGEKGDKGEDGKDGKSSYQIWLDEGNTGSEQDFLNRNKASLPKYATLTKEERNILTDVQHKVGESQGLSTGKWTVALNYSVKHYHGYPEPFRTWIQIQNGVGIIHLDFKGKNEGDTVIAYLPIDCPTPKDMIEIILEDQKTVYLMAGERAIKTYGGPLMEDRRYIVNMMGFFGDFKLASDDVDDLNWNLVFEDNFESDDLDTTKWSEIEYNFPRRAGTNFELRQVRSAYESARA